MDRARFTERLMTTFLGELGEHVRVINAELLALERDPHSPDRPERFKTLFRATHSLKGAARAVGADLIEEACHHIEEVLDAVRDGIMEMGPELFGLFFASADAIEEAGMRLREQHDLAGSPLEALRPRLHDAVRGIVTRPAPTAAVPESPEPAVPTPEVAAPPPTVPLAETTFVRAVGRPEAVGPSALAVTDADAPRNSGGQAFVRLPAEKLDALLARSGELLVARRRVEAGGDDLAALRDPVNRFLGEWRGFVKPLRKHLQCNGEKADAAALSRRTLQGLIRAGEAVARFDKELERFSAETVAGHRLLARATGRLDEEIRRVRMLPFAEACEGFDRTVRDIAYAAGKQVELVVEGGDVELDRSVLERLKDPLMHLVRNAVDHGIESPARRRESGKPPMARVTVKAALRGSQVEVVVVDDGAGLDLDALKQTAQKRGRAIPVDDRDLADLIFLPGFSTAAIITNISGRGVGLDVVKSRIEALHGTIGLSSEPGRGMRFTLSVPLTLTTLRALLIRAGGQVFALAGASVQKLVRVAPADIRTVEGRPVLVVGGPSVPVAPLADVLGLPASEPVTAAGRMPALVVAAGDRRMVFLVTELITEQEIVVKNLGARIRRVGNFSGATILPSGRVALVLNAGGLVRAGLAAAARGRPAPSPIAAPASESARKRLLVVDDSITTRTLEKSILEAAGYDVTTAVDGEAAWQLLQEQAVDLLISDIEMPRMDGFALTEAVRGSSRFARLPVVLFTSRSSERDKARGIEVGADAYIVKGAFDQKDLLETVSQLL